MEYLEGSIQCSISNKGLRNCSNIVWGMVTQVWKEKDYLPHCAKGTEYEHRFWDELTIREYNLKFQIESGNWEVNILTCNKCSLLRWCYKSWEIEKCANSAFTIWHSNTWYWIYTTAKVYHSKSDSKCQRINEYILLLYFPCIWKCFSYSIIFPQIWKYPFEYPESMGSTNIAKEPEPKVQCYDYFF